ncbi:hypothetical protein BWGOE13_29300 [Bacillus mycoides]|uniref:Uncharacterized protein n=1 Tax=Bacillus mycoides TaxID=1405 RepID=A0A1E8BLR0_BACMY|nr:hypothetical protein [Bacillus mycoides]OFD92217.1 hypothetical protein BWGOE11_29610 [Bacillus mycoides]OFE00048.1 hypothetical protein BWGOE13_29300 [Bacillus mycoides]
MVSNDWFADILDKDELLEICTRVRLNIQGFRDINKVPEAMLRRELRRAIQNGDSHIKISKRSNKNVVPFKSLMREVSKYASDKYNGSIETNTIEEFMYNVQYSKDLKPFELIAFIHEYFPNVYKDKFNIFISNKNNNEFILKGIAELKELTTFQKNWQILMHVKENDNKVEEVRAYDKLLSGVKNSPDNISGIVDYVMMSQRYRELKKMNDGTEEVLFEVLKLKELKESERHLAVVAYLMKLDNLSKVENKNYIQLAIYEIQKQRSKWDYIALRDIEDASKSLSKELKKQENENQVVIKVNKKLNSNIQLLNNQNEIVLQQTIQKERDYDLLFEKYQNLLRINATQTAKLNQLEGILNEQNPVIDAYKGQINKLAFIVVINNHDHKRFQNSVLSQYVKTEKEFMKLLNPENISIIRDYVVYINRAIFGNTQEWIVMKELLVEYNIEFFELLGYSMVEYLEQILEYSHKNQQGARLV